MMPSVVVLLPVDVCMDRCSCSLLLIVYVGIFMLSPERRRAPSARGARGRECGHV